MAENPTPVSEGTNAGNAGQPQSTETPQRPTAVRPRDEELDQRDRAKTGPRRPAGPPLAGDHPEPLPVAPMAPETTQEPTDPAES